MGKAKDRARAEAGQPFRNIPESKQAIKCQYPPCKTQILIDKMVPGMPYKGPPPFCPLHLEMLNFYMWCMTAIKVEPQRTPGGVILPGHDKFQATLKEQEREALFNQRVPVK